MIRTWWTWQKPVAFWCRRAAAARRAVMPSGWSLQTHAELRVRDRLIRERAALHHADRPSRFRRSFSWQRRPPKRRRPSAWRTRRLRQRRRTPRRTPRRRSRPPRLRLRRPARRLRRRPGRLTRLSQCCAASGHDAHARWPPFTACSRCGRAAAGPKPAILALESLNPRGIGRGAPLRDAARC